MAVELAWHYHSHDDDMDDEVEVEDLSWEAYCKQETDGYDYQERDGVLWAHRTGAPSTDWTFWDPKLEGWVDEEFLCKVHDIVVD